MATEPAIGLNVTSHAVPVPPHSTAEERRRKAIESGMVVVECVVARLLRHRQKTFIEKDDLLQIGYAQMIATVDRRAVGNLPLEKRIARNVKTVLIRHIKYVQREYRYSQRGNQKAIRDTDAGNQAGDVDGGLDSYGRSEWEDGNLSGGKPEQEIPWACVPMKP